MYNKELFEKIVNLNCPIKELKSFVEKMDKEEFDTDNAFEKYYSLDRIITALGRYKDKEIDAEYLSYWTNAYNWIIMAGFKNAQESHPAHLQDIIIWEITDLLDSLSFIEGGEEFYNIEYYENSICILDKIYKSVDDWKCKFAHTDKLGDNEDDVIFLVVSEKTKEFVKIYCSLYYLSEEIDADKSEDDLEKEALALSAKGYKNLEYGFFDGSDI